MLAICRVVALFGVAFAGAAAAQSWPSKPIRFVNPLGTGGTPRPIVDRVAEELARAARNPAYRDLLASINNEPISSTPEEFRAFLREETAKYGEVIRRTGTRIE